MNNWWQTAQEFLQTLRIPLGITASRAGEHFHAVFGHDSLWSMMLALEAARLRPDDVDYREWTYDLSVAVLRGLAQLQGKIENDYNEEQPGKIVHEYWNPVPEGHRRAGWPLVNGCYYGTLDATFLYMIAMRQFYELFHDKQLLEELWPSLQAAFYWALTYSDMDNDGFVEYERRNPNGHGLQNQVWKDSWDAVLLPGELEVDHPIAWVEVQGYALRAYTSMRSLLMQRNELTPELDAQLAQRSTAISKALHHFWMDDENCPTIALDKHKKAVYAVSSNAGHLLWSEAVDGEQATRIAQRLTRPDILSDWGLRTLSQYTHHYNPLIYHRGTVWPFDNAVVAIGLQRYGFEQEARLLASSVMRAINAFTLPVELYCVLPSRWVREPRLESEWLLADYPQSCSVQAWTAAAILYFTALLEEV